MEKRKRKELTLKEKVRLINMSDGKSQRQLADIFGIGKTQVQGILKRKAEVMEGFECNTDGQRKRICKRSPVEELNSLMWNWFQKARSQGITVSGPMLQERALLYAKDLDISEDLFKASNGWLNRFKLRHKITLHTVCGESGSVDQGTVDDWISRLPDIVKDYEPCNIYNMDETGLFFRALPDKTLSVSGEECKGGKKSKDRITVMLCVNMIGQFEKPLVIGKAAKPRCFRNLSVNKLPVDWKFNKKAWMTSRLFVDWVKLFDKKMKLADRKVVLLLDNAPSHPSDLKLANVKIVFLPANTTSVLQPLDQGIIAAMKQKYRKLLLRSVITKIDDNEKGSAESVSKGVNVLDAIKWVTSAVKDIKPELVRKCFNKCGLSNLESTDSSDEFDDDDIPIAELVEIMRIAKSKLNIEQDMNPNEFINMDSNIPVCENLGDNWEAELVDDLRSENDSVVNDDDDDENDESDKPEVLNVTSHQEALKMISQLKMYCLHKDLPDILQTFDTAQEQLEKISIKMKCNSKQCTIDKFLQ